MQIEEITTPFGRRTMSFVQLARQMANGQNIDQPSYDKWKLFRLICEARTVIGVSDRSLVVLEALLTFYPDDELSLPDKDAEDKTKLIVFPSNQRLSERSHRMAPATMRRHLACLVECGLIIRKDSPNGKRYRRKGHYGQQTVAYGFSLAPLLTRAAEFENMVRNIRIEKATLKSLREELTIARRDIAKLIELGICEDIPADWAQFQARLSAITGTIPRKADIDLLDHALKGYTTLRKEIHKLLENHLKSENVSAIESQNERHIHNSKTDNIIESEVASKNQHEATLATNQIPSLKQSQKYSLGTILQACPDISIYGPRNRVENWQELGFAAEMASTMLGIQTSCWRDACTTLGKEHASTVIACILQRRDRINSPGGYLRTLTDKALDGKFTVGPMLMALMRQDLERIASKPRINQV